MGYCRDKISASSFCDSQLFVVGPSWDANRVQNFPLAVGSGYYYTKKNKL